MIILDTNVLSETLRPTPSARVLEWMRSEPASALFTTAITEAEMLYGIALLPEGRWRGSLEAVVELIFTEELAGRSCLLTALRLVRSPTLPPADVVPGNRSPTRTPASPPSPDPAAPRLRRETSRILRAAGYR